MTHTSPRHSKLHEYPGQSLKGSGEQSKGRMAEPATSPTKDAKESKYYMDNYQATITVHKSPPLQRKQSYDFLEIDDETKDEVDGSFASSRLPKRKNLRVTFSDNIIVDVFDSFDVSSDTESDEGIVEETLYEIPQDRSRGIRQISSSAEFKSVSDNITPARTNNLSSEPVINAAKQSSQNSPTTNEPKSPIKQPSSPRQPLLQKRKTSKVTLSDLEKRTKEYIAKLQEKNKKAEARARVAKAMFPDISAKVKSQPNYKQFIDNAKRAVEITRRYERPWAYGASATQPTVSVWRKRSENVRRTSSLPKNFKLPDDLTATSSRQTSDNVILSASYRQRIRNS
ncbi:uncharacterized protein LOC128243858 [Mya arenaria]|uniref:uncharacterized protein LOC128243858 n=1 Tax=Mya arenaria TaxID=6604 RepID=UPI0022E48AAC|nr:uncharacterized protein LOC128243858 [Mya arenaria]